MKEAGVVKGEIWVAFRDMQDVLKWGKTWRILEIKDTD